MEGPRDRGISTSVDYVVVGVVVGAQWSPCLLFFSSPRFREYFIFRIFLTFRMKTSFFFSPYETLAQLRLCLSLFRSISLSFSLTKSSWATKREGEREMLCLAKQHSISVFLSFSRSLTLSQDARTVFVVV